jgi:hypothetical protein
MLSRWGAFPLLAGGAGSVDRALERRRGRGAAAKGGRSP